MQEHENISICLPLYKPDLAFLQQLADGLRNQSWQSFELIISDDGDDEGLVKDVFQGIPYRYIKNNGAKGIFFNLNNAIREAGNEYIQLLCQDDVMTHTMLEKQVAALEMYPQCAFVYTQSTKIDEKGKIIAQSSDTGTGMISQEDLNNYLLVFGCLPGNLSTVMIKKSVLLKNDLFDTSQLYAADFNMWIRLAQNYGMAVNYDELLLLRAHPSQASFTLANNLAAKDMNVNVRQLYKQSGFNAMKKYFYLNQLYGKTIFIKSLREFLKYKKGSSLTTMFALRFPLNIMVIFPLTLFYYLGLRFKFNFGKYNTFPKPTKQNAS